MDDQGREEEEKTSANIPRIFLEEEGEVRERPSGHWKRYIWSGKNQVDNIFIW